MLGTQWRPTDSDRGGDTPEQHTPKDSEPETEAGLSRDMGADPVKSAAVGIEKDTSNSEAYLCKQTCESADRGGVK